MAVICLYIIQIYRPTLAVDLNWQEDNHCFAMFFEFHIALVKNKIFVHKVNPLKNAKEICDFCA